MDYRQQPEAFVYEIGEKRPEKKANVILTDNIIPAGERDQVMSRVYNAKRGIFNKGIVRNKIVFSVNNLHIYDNLLLFTFEIENKSKLPYDIDYIRYYIIDKENGQADRIPGSGSAGLCSRRNYSSPGTRGERPDEIRDRFR